MLRRSAPHSRDLVARAAAQGATVLPLLLALAVNCAPAATEEPVGGKGGSTATGSGGSTGSAGSSGSAGRSGSAGSGAAGSGAAGSGAAGSGAAGSGAAGSGAAGSGAAGTGAAGSGTAGTGAAGAGGGGQAGAGGSAGGTPDANPGTPPPGMPTCSAEPAATPPALKKTPVVRIPGDDQAGQVIGVPGEKGIYIIGHRTGKLFYAEGGKLDPTPMASVAIKNNKGQDEQGMLGVALHPNFAQNHLFYLLYTAPNGNIRIDELERTGMNSSKPVKTIWDEARVGGGAFHNGGQIYFSPKDSDKGLLYHAVGNTASVGASGQAMGKVGRVLVHDVAMPNMGTTVSFGLRNPYRMSIDRLTGDMYVGEIDDPPGGAIYFSPADARVKDFGYRGGGVKAGVTGKEGDKAVVGGVVYRGSKIAGICGRYFFASWPGGRIKSIYVKDGKMQGGAAMHGEASVGSIASFGEDGDGEMYISTQGAEVYRIDAN